MTRDGFERILEKGRTNCRRRGDAEKAAQIQRYLARNDIEGSGDSFLNSLRFSPSPGPIPIIESIFPGRPGTVLSLRDRAYRYLMSSFDQIKNFQAGLFWNKEITEA